jgi:hypothetical protein
MPQEDRIISQAGLLAKLQEIELRKKKASKDQLRELRKHGELIREELDESLLTRFDKLMERYGFAVAEVLDGACQGCNMRIATKMNSAIEGSNDIYICENCGKFLVSPRKKKKELAARSAHHFNPVQVISLVGSFLGLELLDPEAFDFEHRRSGQPFHEQAVLLQLGEDFGIRDSKDIGIGEPHAPFPGPVGKIGDGMDLDFVGGPYLRPPALAPGNDLGLIGMDGERARRSPPPAPALPGAAGFPG